ncbi:porin family protein [Taibaiella koreensis]|uniref:hypothetical protein n=1 Tax=Taibaiella koreensis TaxID=1268548 RepID=UPI000E59A94D|nr:hypothetical protein [Taibaiella koreensis]
MDNQKDFIHIDDLFKKLRNAEEPERPGSWLHMKELLDKEMPLGTVVSAGRSFRRFLIPVLAVMLAAGGGATYYKLNESSKTPAASLTAARHTVGVPAAGSDARPRLSADGSRNNGNGNNGPSDSQTTAAGIAPNRDRTRNTRSGSGTAAPELATTHTGNAHAATAAVNRTGGPQQKTNAAGLGNPASAAAHETSTGRPQQHAAMATNNGAQRKTEVHTAGNTGEVMEEQRVIEQIKPGRSAANAKNAEPAIAGEIMQPAAGNKNYASGNTGVKQLPLALNSKKIVRDNNGNLYKEERDTFKRIDLVERLVASGNRNQGGSSYKTAMDTVAVTRVEKVRYVPLDQLELVTLRKMGIEASTKKIIPSASLKERTLSKKEIVSLVPLNQYKVASRRVDPGKFNQLIQNTSQGISNYFDGSHNFYTGILVGGNASFGNPGAFGMQLGVAGLYSLGERLTLTAELKYVNHYFSNYSVEDRSVTFENISSQQVGSGWLFSGQQNTTTSAYKINSFSALEMPVTLSYNLGRLSIFAGLDMAYAFPIKWSKENTFNTTNVEQNQSQNQNPFRDAFFKVDEQKDFGSRFGLGYVWGMSYDVSRKVSLDARVSQIVWDNSTGKTDAINRMFRIPTMQFSIGYYFGRKDKVIYIMDKR